MTCRRALLEKEEGRKQFRGADVHFPGADVLIPAADRQTTPDGRPILGDD
jgi:hypothetical protein